MWNEGCGEGRPECIPLSLWEEGLPEALPGWLDAGNEQNDTGIAPDALFDAVGFEKPVQDEALQMTDPLDAFPAKAAENSLQILTWSGIEKSVSIAIAQVKP